MTHMSPDMNLKPNENKTVDLVNCTKVVLYTVIELFRRTGTYYKQTYLEH